MRARRGKESGKRTFGTLPSLIPNLLIQEVVFMYCECRNHKFLEIITMNVTFNDSQYDASSLLPESDRRGVVMFKRAENVPQGTGHGVRRLPFELTRNRTSTYEWHDVSFACFITHIPTFSCS